MLIRTVLVSSVLLLSTAYADNLSCPVNSKGQHPKCLCNDDNPYDPVNRICATEINAEFLLAKCPKGSEGSFPACICPEGKVYVAQKDACVEVDRSQCPAGSTKVKGTCKCEVVDNLKYQFDEIFWICRPWYIPIPTTTTTTERITTRPPTPRPTCGAHQEGTYPDCHWLPCPKDYVTKTGFWPDCTTVYVPTCASKGMIGTWPDCHHAPPPPPTIAPCPQYQYRNKEGVCERIKCPPGQEGDFQPNCKFQPKCPPEYPGVWPNCNIYATTPSSNLRTTTSENQITISTRKPTTTGPTYLPPTKPTPTTTKATTTTRRTTTTTITPKPRTTPYVPPSTTVRPTTNGPTYLPPTKTPTTTTKKPVQRCSCQCYSDEIIIFKDGVELNPFEKYRKSANKY